jgi:hypothetical protein
VGVCRAGDVLVCDHALLLSNTGNRRLGNITASGDASCSMQPGTWLEPDAHFNCTVRLTTQQIFCRCHHSTWGLKRDHTRLDEVSTGVSLVQRHMIGVAVSFTCR